MDEYLQILWGRLCRTGCGYCKNLIHKRGVPICNRTGNILEEKPAQYEGVGADEQYPPVPFPSKNCPFNTD